MKTKVVTDEDFNGKKQFKIYAVDENNEKLTEFDKKTGEKKVKRPIFNFGIAKAQTLENHSDEIIAFINDNYKG